MVEQNIVSTQLLLSVQGHISNKFKNQEDPISFNNFVLLCGQYYGR